MDEPRSISTLNEAQARYILIDPALRAAGWDLGDRTQVRFEVPVDGYDAEPWNGVTDYCLYDASGAVLAVIEAKRTCRSPREGEEQLRHYVTEIARHQSFVPFGSMSIRMSVNRHLSNSACPTILQQQNSRNSRR